jgi:predicted small metal-binding protein
MSRKVADCRDTPSVVGCTLMISGEEEEVVRAASEHAISVHSHADTPELREQVRATLKDELVPSVAPSARASDTL